MKTINIYKVSLALVMILVLGACNNLLQDADLKTSPNYPIISQVNVSALTSGTMVGVGTLYEDTDNRIASIWAGQLAGVSRQHQTFQNYTVSASAFSWQNYYNTAENAVLIQQKSNGLSNLQVGVGQILEALVMQKLVCLFGDVPFSEAFDVANHPKPKYDDQIAVYNSLITLLSTAITNLNSGVGRIEGDFIYNGVASKWVKLAYSLQARMYLHLKNYASAAAAAATGLGSNADDFLMPHGTAQQVDQNLNFDFFNNSRPGDTSFDSPPSYIPVFMSTNYQTGVWTQDAAIRNSKTTELGIYWHFFLDPNDANNITGDFDPNYSDGAYQANSSSPIFTYYETQLIRAEALERLAGPTVVDPNALIALNNVRAGLQTGYIFGATSVHGGSNYAAYVAADFSAAGACNPTTGPNAGKNEQLAMLTEIASQKYIILILQFEAFNELRRLQVATPVVNLNIPIYFGSVYPGRFIYPQNELNTNPNTPNPAPNQYVKLKLFQ